MLHAESRIRVLEYQDEVATEPCSKKMKSTERAYEKPSDDDNQGIWEEVHTERAPDDLVPAYASGNQWQCEMQKQEKIPAEVLGALNEVLPENNLVLSQPVHSETVQNINPPTSFSLNRNASDDEFFTSKEFIGPIYKPAESNGRDKSGSCNECRSNERDQNELHEKRAKIKEAKEMQTISSAAPEIDDELDQFYKEIHQLENENLTTNFQEKETETTQEQCSPPQPFHENGQCFFGEQNSQKTSNEQQFVAETSGWKTDGTFNGQVDSKIWNYSVPEFRPAWQSAGSFVVPQGPPPPPPPRFNHQLHFQILNSPPQETNAFPSQNGEVFYKNYQDYRGNTDINSHGPLPDQGTKYAGHTDIHTAQVFRNGNNEQNGLQNNGFCETREERWKEPKADGTEGTHSFSSLQLPEGRFCSQKWLLILRGLPGSGKSTLSR
ncbi:NEDD4-binding protein 2-like 2 [Apaloderma vittatum]|nr:NEDD4-binding protein 2-like 2 [Apaloderma vittatum]